MSLEIKNPGFISKITNTSGVVGTQLVDSSDHIHTGLIKILSQQSRGNFAIANAASSGDMGFKITQTTSSGTTGNTILTVTAGKIFKDGAYTSVSGATFTAGSSPSSFQEPSSGSAYFLLVVDSSDTLKIRGSSSTVDKVPDYTAGDTIIALIKMNKDDSNKENRFLQYLTTDKTANSLSIGYTNSNAYAEALSVSGASGGTTFTNKITDGKITFTMTGDDSAFRIESTTNSANTGPTLELFRNQTDAEDDDYVGIIKFLGEDSGNTETEYARIQAQIADETNTTEDSQLFIRTLSNGSLQYNMKFTPTQTIFNAGNDNIDIRIDGDTNDYLFYADAGNEKIGIGTNVADRKLHIEEEDSGTNTVLYPLRLTRTSSGTVAAGIGTGMEFEIETTAGNHVGATIEAVTTDVGSGAEDVDLVVKTMLAGSAANEALRIHDDGNLTVAGDLTVTGNDITFGNGATIVNTSSSLLTITEATVTASAALTAGTTITAGTVCTGATGIATGGYIQGGYAALTAHATNHAAGTIDERFYVIIGSGGVSMQLPAASANAGKIVTYHNSIAGVTQLVPKSGSGDTFNGGIDPAVIATADRGPAGGAAPPNYIVHIGVNSIALDQGQTVTLMAVTDDGSMPSTGWYILS